MEASPPDRGAVVDARLAPAGLTRLLGSYGAGRASVLLLAGVLIGGACLARAIAPVPGVTLGVAFIVAVTIVASEFGIGSGVRCAGAAILAMTALTLCGLADEGVTTIVGRSAVLLFLAPVVGHATERAARSRRLLEQVLEATTDSIYVKDLEGRYLIINSPTAQLIGRPGAEIIGRTNADLLPDVAADIAVRDHDVIDRETASNYEIGGRFGERRYVLSVSKSPFRDAGGKAIGSLGIARDITDQRRLQEESTRFFDLSGDMLATIDYDGRMHRVNGEWTRRVGWRVDELLGASIFDFVPAEEHAAMSAATRAARGEEGSMLTTRWRAKDGSLHWIAWSLRTVHEDRTVYASGRDVTRELEREREIGEAQERFRRAFEDAPIGMAVATLEGRFLEVNQALCAITGYTPEQLTGTGFSSITHPEDVAADLEVMRRLVAGELQTSADEKRYLRPDGSVVWVARSVTLVRDADGRPLHLLDQIQDITERRRFEHELRQLADHDPLTGLLNRRRFEHELERHVAEVRRYGPRGALLVLDLDHFKYVNDALGHHAGDELILSVAALLQDRLRSSDTLARLGGDEFAVLLPHADAGEAEHVAQTLVQAVREQATVSAVGRRRRVTTSVGVAPFGRGDVSGEEVLIEADLAMYEAKEAGRDRYALVSADAERPARVRARGSWLDRIRSALDDDGFVLYAQPIRDLHSGRIPQYELLLRMRGEGGDVIGPAAFLPLAERFGLAPEIDRWVVGQAIALLAEDPGGEIALEVNLSGPSLNDTGLLRLIETEIRRLDVDPRRLTFEITETAAVANIPLARRFADRLMQLGCRFALDDFGSGFGSFYYLKHLPFDFLKIDGEFVSGALTSRTDQLVIEAVVRIARGLGKQTIAEFVSTPELEAFMREQGVDYAQGFEVGPPVPVGELRLGRPPARVS